MLTKDLLRVSRAGGGYQPQFATERNQETAARVIGCYQGHVGESREQLQDALTEIERESEDFKLVRGFAKLLDREAVWAVESTVDPSRAREATFEAAAAVGVVTESEREQALAQAGRRLDTDPAAVEQSLYADLERREILSEIESRWGPGELIDRYNLSLAQTALFDATEVRIDSADPKALVSAVKRLGLMYEIHSDDGDWELVVTGPETLFRSTRRYGTQFARLLRTVAKTTEWQLTATVDDRGTERTLTLSGADPIGVPGSEPIATDQFDSSVEATFASRFRSLDLDWELLREPAPLAAGARVMIPDFVFAHDHADFRVFFEIMGFWTPAYVEKKLAQLEAVEGVEMLVAVDESLGVSERIEARDHRAITYDGTVSLKKVRNALRPYEAEIDAAIADEMPAELRPEADVVTLETLAAEHGVTESVIEDVAVPEHERVGRTLVRQRVLDTVEEQLEAGLSLTEAENLLSDAGLTETSAVLSRLGYEVAWEGLDGGTLKRQE